MAARALVGHKAYDLESGQGKWIIVGVGEKHAYIEKNGAPATRTKDLIVYHEDPEEFLSQLAERLITSVDKIEGCTIIPLHAGYFPGT
jgi:phage protein U